MNASEIVCDTGALITLERLPWGYEFIKILYNRIIIPKKVADEISIKYKSIDEYLNLYDIHDLVYIQTIEPKELILEPELHDGEIEAISLAIKLKCDLLIEEHDGRKVALQRRLKISGIAGQIKKAYENKLINRQEASDKINSLYQINRINKLIQNKLLIYLNTH